MNRWNRKFLFLLGGLCALVLNFEPLLLGGNGSVGETYISITFSLDYFLNKKQFLVSVKQLFVIFVFFFFYGGKIKNQYIIYTYLRLGKKRLWMFKQFMYLWGNAGLFFGMYAAVTLGICAIGCGKIPVATDYLIVFMSVFSFSYMGCVFAAIVNGASLFIKIQNAMIIGYLAMVVVTFLSMAESDFLGRYPLLMYVNPITSMSMADCHDIWLIAEGIGVCVAGYMALSYILVYFSSRIEYQF